MVGIRVRAEATIADRAGTLMPAMIEPCQRPVMFELRLAADLTGWHGDAADPRWQGFVDDVRTLTGGAKLAAPIAVTPTPAARSIQPGRWATVAVALLALTGFGTGEWDPGLWAAAYGDNELALADAAGRSR